MTSTTNTTLAPTLLSRVRRSRSVLAAIGLLLLTAVVLTWAARPGSTGQLDPDSAEPTGARALARLLTDQGVQVETVRTAEDAARASATDSTLLVIRPDLLRERALERLATATPNRLVLVEAAGPALHELVGDVRVAGSVPVQARDPQCSQSDAVRAQAADTGALTYAATESAPGEFGCYPGDGEASLLLRPPRGDRPETVLLGASQLLTNERLALQGNASLATGLLGSQPTLVWYLPALVDPLDAATAPASVSSLLPAWVPWVVLQLLITGFAAALWRVRRLGPVTIEPLPVIVRSAETTEGRGRLLRRAGGRDRAAAALRMATRTRIAAQAGLPPAASAQAVAQAATVQAAARGVALQPRAVSDTLYGPPPADDAELRRLALALDRLTSVSAVPNPDAPVRPMRTPSAPASTDPATDPAAGPATGAP